MSEKIFRRGTCISIRSIRRSSTDQRHYLYFRKSQKWTR
uniref:Uncharacterized protein n=1 Tax=Romanomermis culicivorax TaxID=13658 RepID=A0A915KVM5_ROMCU